MQFTQNTADEHVVCIRDINKTTLEVYNQLNQSELRSLSRQINILKLRKTNLKQGMHSSYLNQNLREMLNIDLGADLVSSLRQSPVVLSRVPLPRATLPQQPLPLHGDEDSSENVEAEVNRLETLKASKMEELIFKKRLELEDICRKMHMIPELASGLEFSAGASITGDGDPTHILEQIELQIVNKKEEALSRREILEKVEKWIAACEEERWLQEYNKDANRYNSRRGTHLIMKRAETARALVRKLPGMVQTLALKTDAWEKKRGTEFIYDGTRLLSILEGYNEIRQKEEQEHKNQKDKKNLKEQVVEQEALFRSEPSPKKSKTLEKGSRLSYGGTSNQRLSLGVQSPKTDKLQLPNPKTGQTKKNDRPQQNG